MGGKLLDWPERFNVATEPDRDFMLFMLSRTEIALLTLLLSICSTFIVDDDEFYGYKSKKFATF